jgi:hypothetical protein
MAVGSYTFTVEHLSGGRVRIDYIKFAYKMSPIERTSWGTVKALFR